MKYKTGVLIILAILFLGIILFRFFKIENIEGLTDIEKQNKNVLAAQSYLLNRYEKKHNPYGISDKTIIDNINRLANYGNDSLNETVRHVLENIDFSDSEKVDELDIIFAIPPYDPLNDGLVIHYDFKDIDISDPNQPVFPNTVLTSYSETLPATYNGKIILYTSDADFTVVKDNTNAIINNSHLKILGNGYILSNSLPTFYIPTFSGFSVSLWYMPLDTPDTKYIASLIRLFDFGNGPGVDNIIIAYNTDRKHLHFYLCNTTGCLESNLRSPLFSNNQKWKHLVWTISPDGVWLVYVNNQLLLNEQMGIPSKVLRRLNYIGKSNWPDDNVTHCKIADFRIYNREITIDEVNLLYNLASISTSDISTDLPVLKNKNIIQNGCFSYPRIQNENAGYMDVPSIQNWIATRNTLVNDNIAFPLIDPKFGIYTQIGVIGGNGTGFLQQNAIRLEANVQYTLSFIHSLWKGSTAIDNTYLMVTFGCYVNTGSDTSIKPTMENWNLYSVNFTTDPNCTNDSLKIRLYTTSTNILCGITCVSLRKS